MNPSPCSALGRLVRPVLLLATLALAACASTTDIVRSSEEARPTKPAVTLLVAGVSTDDALRRQYETAFIAELERAGLHGIASSDLIPTLAGLTMPQIRERMMANADRADAVLHVQLMGLVASPALSPQDVPSDTATASRTINGTTVTLNAPPDAPHGAQYAVDLEANLYQLPARTLLWTAVTRTHEANSVTAIAHSHARALIKAMRERGYVAAGH